MDRLFDELSASLKERGCSVRIVSISHTLDLKEELHDLRHRSLVDSEFYQRRLSWFSFAPSENLPDAQSLIVVAVPRPQTRAIFSCKERKFPLIVPPTYTSYDAIEDQVCGLLARMLHEKGYALAKTALPLKLLAVRSGLGQYGRNNVCYVSGMGSFLQLVAFYSNLPCEEDAWGEKTMMSSCHECDLCRRACPTGAISPDRFLLHAERCISYHNEKTGENPFPKWINASWHNCIVGCMRCQKACPQNRKFIPWIGEEEDFSEAETSMILQGLPKEKLPVSILRKLEHLSLNEYLGCIPRNLSVFLNDGQ